MQYDDIHQPLRFKLNFEANLAIKYFESHGGLGKKKYLHHIMPCILMFCNISQFLTTFGTARISSKNLSLNLATCMKLNCFVDEHTQHHISVSYLNRCWHRCRKQLKFVWQDSVNQLLNLAQTKQCYLNKMMKLKCWLIPL